MKSIFAWSLSGAAFLPVISVVIAAGFVFNNDGFGSGDLFAFGFWSFLVSIIVYPFLRVFARISKDWPFYLAYFGAAILGLVFTFVWMFLVKMILGPWIMAFSFPVFTCWIFGITGSFLIVAAERNKSTWYVGLLFSFIFPFIAVVSLATSAPTPPPDLYAILSSGLTSEQRSAAWGLFQTKVTRTYEDYNPEGFRSVSSFQLSGHEGLRVTFHPNSDSIKREEAIQKAIASPLIYEMWEGELNNPKRALKKSNSNLKSTLN